MLRWIVDGFGLARGKKETRKLGGHRFERIRWLLLLPVSDDHTKNPKVRVRPVGWLQSSTCITKVHCFRSITLATMFTTLFLFLLFLMMGRED